MSKAKLPESDSLKELQEYLRQTSIERGFNIDDPARKFIMLMEEVGELAKAIRETTGGKFSATTKRKELEEELADVQIILLGLANIFSIDMGTVFKEKETQNQQRVWK